MSRVTRLDDSRLSTKEPPQYWGFANFPNQVFRRAVKNGFDFTLMVVGRSGLGKSTFINTLFMSELNDPMEPQFEIPVGSTVSIVEKHVRLAEESVILNLTLIDTPGFGDAVNNDQCWVPIRDYIDKKFLEYFTEETKVERSQKMADKCVHLCLYFIEPSGHGLKPLDIEVMKQLHTKVNIIPIIAKADTLTKDELRRFKSQVDQDIKSNEIKIYQFPEFESDDDKMKSSQNPRLPFAVVGSNLIRELHGKKLRYREYPWGVVEVENLDHNDFIPLRDLVIRTNLIDLIDVTRNVHYENFRFTQMEKLHCKNSGDRSRDPFTHTEEENKQKELELQKKKHDLNVQFDTKFKEREAKILKRSSEISNREIELREQIAARRAELDRLKTEIAEMKSGNTSHDSKTSLNSENHGDMGLEKTKKKTSTLGLWNRN